MQSTGGWNVATGNAEFVASTLAKTLGLLSPEPGQGSYTVLG